MGSRGGRRIRVNVFQNINTKDVVIGVDSLDKELSNNMKDGVRVWVPIYRTKVKSGQRPSQAFKDLQWRFHDLEFISFGSPAANVVEYLANDMNLTKGKRLSSQK